MGLTDALAVGHNPYMNMEIKTESPRLAVTQGEWYASGLLATISTDLRQMDGIPDVIGAVKMDCRTVWCFPQFDSAAIGCGAVELDDLNFRSTVTAVGMCTPFVATPALVVEQPGMQAMEFPTLRLSEPPKLLPSFGLSSSSPSPTLPWGAAEDSALFAQPCSGGTLAGCSGRGQFVQCATAFTGTLLSASTREHVASGWKGPIADDVRGL